MKQLSVINLESADSFEIEGYKERTAARVVVIDAQKQVALMHIATGDYYKLAGGGVDSNESLESAAVREVREETGWEIEILKELGEVIETRASEKLRQTSVAYLAKIQGEGHQPDQTEDELLAGYSTVWFENIDKAIHAIESKVPKNMLGKYVLERDSRILKEAKSYL